jgi:hypothetical protein
MFVILKGFDDDAFRLVAGYYFVGELLAAARTTTNWGSL